MASVSDMIKLAVSTAVSNAAKTAASTRSSKTSSSSKSTASSGSKSSSSGYYDPNKDYSKELQRTDLTSAQRTQLESERQNKINDKYGGVEPNMTGSDKTYSQSYGSQSSRDRDIQTISKPGGTLYYDDGRAAVTNTGKAWQEGVDYSAEAAKYAAMGDWDGVNDVLMRRAAKMQDTGSTGGGKSNLELWKELNDRYNGPSAGVSLADMQAGAERAYGPGGQYGSGYGDETQIPSNQSTGNQLYGTTGYGSFEDFLADTGYDQYAAETQAAIKAAVQNAINGYRDQIDTTNQDTDELARQAYIAKMLGQKNLDQQLSANGYAGGMADSQRIATETNYQNQLNELEKQRQATVKELESAITNAQLTGDMQTAQELASYLQQIQGQWVNYVQNQQQMAQQDYWNQKQLDNNDYWNQKNMENDNYWNQQSVNAQNQESAYTRALQLLDAGFMPDDETLTAAGISRNEAQNYVNQPQAQNVQYATPAAGNSGGSTVRGGGYNNGSLTTSQVKQLQQALGVTADGLWGSKSTAAAGGMTADQAWAAYQNQTKTANAGMNASYFNAFMQSMVAQMSAGKMQAAQANIEANWDKLSESQKEQLIALTQRYS